MGIDDPSPTIRVTALQAHAQRGTRCKAVSGQGAVFREWFSVKSGTYVPRI